MAEEKLGWEDFPEDAEENVTKDDVVNAEAGGGVPPGKYLCLLERTTLKRKTRSEVLINSVECLFKVIQALEVEGVPGEYPEMANKKIVDSIDLFVKGEKDFFKNRRVLFLRRIGGIKSEGDRVTMETWGKVIVGKRIIVHVIRDHYTDKNKVQKESIKVGPMGYFCADNAQDPTSTTDYSDV